MFSEKCQIKNLSLKSSPLFVIYYYFGTLFYLHGLIVHVKLSYRLKYTHTNIIYTHLNNKVGYSRCNLSLISVSWYIYVVQGPSNHIPTRTICPYNVIFQRQSFIIPTTSKWWHVHDVFWLMTLSGHRDVKLRLIINCFQIMLSMWSFKS